MDTFRMMSLSACFVGIVITIFSSLYPSDKFEKQVKVIFSLVFLLSIINPVINGRMELPDIDEIAAASTDYYDSLSENTEQFFAESVERNISVMLESELNKKNIFPEKIITEINISDDSSISITEVTVIASVTENPDAIRSCIEQYAGTRAVVVKTKEGQYEQE